MVVIEKNIVKMCRFHRAFICAFFTVTFFASISHGSRKCSNVKEEFSKLQLGSLVAVPDEPIIGE